MRVTATDDVTLTYCTSIHAADGWEAVLTALRQGPPTLRQRLNTRAGATLEAGHESRASKTLEPFAVGLRLSNAESTSFTGGPPRVALEQLLRDERLTVPVLNGFPFGAFHGRRVKEEVFAPDWRTEARLAYTLQLADLGARLPGAPASVGVSTCPLSYRAWVTEEENGYVEIICDQMARAVAHLVDLEQTTGCTVHLDIEPEPDGLVETCAELAAFFSDRLLPRASAWLCENRGLTRATADEAVRRHVQACVDTCHLDVTFEDFGTALDRLRAAGMRVGRVQLAAALAVAVPSDAATRRAIGDRLQPFAESVWLHQVRERLSDGTVRRHADLPAALAAGFHEAATEWRIHYHIPLYATLATPLRAAADAVRAALATPQRTIFPEGPGCLEIETYTYPELVSRGAQSEIPDLVASIEREYLWVLDALT